MTAESSSADPVQDQKKAQNQDGAKHWAYAVATFFGMGYLKPAPGTWASVAAMLLWAAAAWDLHLSSLGLLLALAAGIALVLVFGIPAATVVERESGHHDPHFVVIDEVAGQWVALLFSPADWRHGIMALILFRLFDVTKPFPIRRLERLPGGWGIVFDDVAAGLYALVSAVLLRILLHRWF